MKASISFYELQKIINEKAKQVVSFSCVNAKTVKIIYPIDLGFIKKDISADLIIKELKGSDLLIQLSAGLGTDTLLKTVLSLLKNKIPETLVEKRPDSHLLLHLGEVEQAKQVLEKITVNDLHVIADGFEVEGDLKL